jgi:hypothetical protein
MQRYAVSVAVPPVVHFHTMAGEDWESLLEKMEEDTRESHHRNYITGETSPQVSWSLYSVFK